ncbi:hypothetical protein ASF04_05285 [Duganella sp. Leaf61]|uniref:C1 family peptidase n=1 Tax=Duganella sp. Leaf61 TaxID=1736227 RepID=UPI0006F5EC11|nr:C1 family peptidase [Duganella sp. Leaf61]KQN75488.1 hypothetical protein ASF04_05285 [Duganella sp. Leaf61]
MPTRHLQFDDQTVRLDARADRLDPRDRPYAPPLAALPPRWPEDARLRRLLPAYVRQGLVLDQSAHGEHGACTGYGLAAVVNFLLWQREGAPTAPVSPHMLYDLARFYDEWPGEEYEGSSCRGAIKGWSKHGSCLAPLWQASVHADPHAAVGYRPDPRWAADAATRPLGVYYRVDRDAITDMQAALHAIGALYVSASVHAGWLAVAAGSGLAQGHDGLPVIGYDGMAADAGNHAFAIVGYNEHGFVVQNSWGEDWGASGFAVVRYDDWRNNGLDCWVAALGVPQVAAVSAVGRQPASALGTLSNAALANVSSNAGDVRHAGRAGAVGGIGGTGAAGDSRNVGGAEVTGGAGRVDVATAAAKSRRIGVSLAAADPPVLANPALAGALPWSTDTAYAHTLVSGNNGVLRSSRPDIGRAADLVAVAVDEGLGAWLRSGSSGSNGVSGGRKKVVIYAHGGLNTESASLRRIRVMGPYFAANGIYPLFYTWRTGVLETLGGLLYDAVGDVAAPALAGRTFSDAKDGLLETVAHQVRWAWREMQDNAARAAQDGGALALLAAALVRLWQEHPALEIHLAGHSAGAFVHGHLLELCRAARLPVASVTLYAPACSLAFARRCFVAAVTAGVVPRDRFWLHLLSDAAERDDTVGPYGKSLLYLVARGFEEVRKTPLAGLQRTVDATALQPDDDLWRAADWPQVRAWRAWVAALPAQADGVPACEVTGMRMPVSLQRAVKPAHNAFDNDIVILTRTINRVLGRSPGTALDAPVTDLDY